MAIINVIGDKLTQWDLNRYVWIKLPVDAGVFRVDFEQKVNGNIVVQSVDVKQCDEKLVAAIPNIYLQESEDIKVYVMVREEETDTERTVFYRCLGVDAKEKPPEYIYEETEVLNYRNLEKRIEHLEQIGEQVLFFVEEGDTYVKEFQTVDDGNGNVSVLSSLNLEDDGEGNVIILSEHLEVTDDGNGNVVVL